MRFITPTFREMFEEFQFELPPVMKFISNLGDAFGSVGANLLLALLFMGFSAFIFCVVCLWLFPVLTLVPGIRWFFNDYYGNLGFVALAKAAEIEPNLADACSTTAELVPVRYISDRYRGSAVLIASGMKPTDAFVSSGLLRKREIKAIGFGLESQNPAWGLSQLASLRIERMLRWYSMLLQTAIVILTISLGIVVGTFAIGVFQCLSVMILNTAIW